jgi:hypothetical protein
MKLTDLRKLAIRKQLRIRFAVSHGLECVVNRDGVAQVPGLRRSSELNLEQELAAASQFLLESAPAGTKAPPIPKPVSRQELAALAESGLVAETHDHEEE